MTGKGKLHGSGGRKEGRKEGRKKKVGVERREGGREERCIRGISDGKERRKEGGG